MDRSNSDNEDHDELQLRFDPTIKKLLVPGEYVMMSCLVYKFNKRLKRQERSLLLTSKYLYNINKQDFLVNFISIFNGNYAVRRKIDITKLAGITVSELSSEFVVHVRNEFDFRYASQDKRDRIITMLCKVYWMNVKNKLIPFFFKDDINLVDFATSEDDVKKSINRMPKEGAALMDEFSLKKKIEDNLKKREKMKANTETVFNKDTTTGPKVTLDDFEIIKVLGRGAFGKVMLVEKKDNKQLYALKSMHKEDIIGKDQIEHTKTERYVLEKSKCPFLVSLEYAFQTPEKIFFVMKYMKGGELFQHLKSARRFEEERAKLYVAEIVLALEYLHNLDVIYRDLKPENVLMDEDGHICLTDFGMSKRLKQGQLTFSFVGTPEYLAPEIIKGEGHSRPADWWALGILTYEMIVGLPPFYNKDQNTQKMFNSIKDKEIGFTSKVSLSPEAKDLILGLVKKRPEDRLGYRGADEIKAHKWFRNIDWNLLSQKKIEPSFKPKITSEYDVNNFDSEFTKEDPCNSLIPNGNMRLVNKYQKEFKDFTYMPNDGLLHNG